MKLLYHRQETKHGFDFIVERETAEKEVCLKISFQYYANMMYIRSFYAKDIEAGYSQGILGGEIFIVLDGLRYSLDVMVECGETFTIEI